VTVLNGPEDPEQIEIRDVRAKRIVTEPPETVRVTAVATEVKEIPRERATEIMVDLGFRNLPLHEVTLKFGEADFYRRVSVRGRNHKTRRVTIPAEDGGTQTREVEEPWSHVSGGCIYRYTSGGARDELLTLDLSGAACRFLNVRIENADDPPLNFKEAEVTRLQCYLGFPPRAAGRFALYFGNPEAVPPAYDIVHYIGRLRQEGVVPAALGTPVALVEAPVERIPWTERHKWIIWIALLAALAVLGGLLYRQLKAAPRPPQ
jgi:hypothetical protein